MIGDTAFVPINLAALALALRVAWNRSIDGRVRRAWLLIGLGLGGYLLGNLAQLVVETMLHQPASPSIADVFYLAFYPLVFAGILQFPRERSARFSLVRLGLDATATLIAATAIVWYVTLASATESHATVTERVITLAYPCGDLLLLLALTGVAIRTRRILGTWALGLMKTSLLLYVSADVIYSRMILEGTYSGGAWVDVGWMFAIALLGASANEQYRVSTQGLSPGEIRHADSEITFLPYVATAITFGLTVASSGREGRLEGGTLLLLGLALAVVVARLHWSTLNSRRLHLAAELARADFFASISHELRTPLTSIRGYCELLEDLEDLSPQAREFVRIVQRSTSREERLVSDLLLLNSPDSLQGIHIGNADLVQVVCDSVASHLPAARRAGIEVASDLPHGEVTVRADADRLGQAIDNLLTNAIKFASSSVQITLLSSSGRAILTVQDDGPGIPENEKDHVFERLYRGKFASENEIPGAGLGLAIASGVIAASQGSLYVDSGNDAGATFCVELPTVSGRAAEHLPSSGPKHLGAAHVTGMIPAACGLSDPVEFEITSTARGATRQRRTRTTGSPVFAGNVITASSSRPTRHSTDPVAKSAK